MRSWIMKMGDMCFACMRPLLFCICKDKGKIED